PRPERRSARTSCGLACGSRPASRRRRSPGTTLRITQFLLPLGAEGAEARPLVPGPCAVLEDGHLLAAGVVRVALHNPAADLRNQIHGATKGGRRHSFAPVLPVHEDAGDPVVGRLVESGLVLLAVVDVRQFLRGAVLAPRHCLTTVEHQRSVSAALLDQPLLEGTVALGCERLLGMEGVEPGAPTATEHTVVPLDEPRECVPGIRIERLDYVVRHGVSLALVRAA